MPEVDYNDLHAGIEVGDIVYYLDGALYQPNDVYRTRVMAKSEAGRIGTRQRFGTGTRPSYTDMRYYKTFQQAKVALVAYRIGKVAEAENDLKRMQALLEKARTLTPPEGCE